jgi:hypothetical protein
LDTPSQSGDCTHSIYENEESEDDDFNQHPVMQRILNGTEVLNIYENYYLKLQHKKKKN